MTNSRNKTQLQLGTQHNTIYSKMPMSLMSSARKHNMLLGFISILCPLPISGPENAYTVYINIVYIPVFTSFSHH